jgi:hypothetical protein
VFGAACTSRISRAQDRFPNHFEIIETGFAAAKPLPGPLLTLLFQKDDNRYDVPTFDILQRESPLLGAFVGMEKTCSFLPLQHNRHLDHEERNL